MHTDASFLSDFFQLVNSQTKEEFLETFPDPFLLQSKGLIDDCPSTAHFTTLRFKRVEPNTMLSPALREKGKLRVFKVRKDDLNAFADMITIGRASNNDISLPFASISKFHAYFKVDGDDCTLTDAGSTNGTFLNNDQLDPDKPSIMNDGDGLSVSPQTNFTFYRPGSFYDWVKDLLQTQ
jgi:hypothetical protein